MKVLEKGQRVDHFSIVRKLGQGGMSEVYLARDTTLGRKVALKIIRAEFAESPQRLNLFLHEARLTAKFSHPHIITIHFVGKFEGHPYLALEYLQGQTLSQRMREGPMSARETIRIGLAIAQALEESHSHGVLHRDLKPANVIIPHDGRLRVLDFGISKIVEDDFHPPAPVGVQDNEVKPEETAFGEIKGTPNYMAPERWLGEKVTGAADVWALGVILYMMLSQVHPFHGEDRRTEAIAQRIVSASGPPPLPPELDVLPDLAQLINSMLDRTSRQRPTAKIAVEVLQMLLQRNRCQPFETRSPFRGLLPFSERHADLFFGRNAEIEVAVERLRHEPILPIVGPSGAGKSSFVAAGIVPRLRELDRWLVLTVRPGTDPFRALSSVIHAGREGEVGHTVSPSSSAKPHILVQLVAQEIVGKEKENLENATLNSTDTVSELKLPRKSRGNPEANSNPSSCGLAQKLLKSPATLLLELQAIAEENRSKVLLFVDQLEELYTHEHELYLRRAYMEAISCAADDPEGPIRVVFTLRDDFLGHVADTPSARQVLSRITVLRAPGEEALEEIVKGPVDLAGYSYEDSGLPEEMIDAVRGAPASLPILQFACSQLWNRRDSKSRLLTRSAYEAMGGVEGALSSEADTLLAGLSLSQRKTMKQLMLRLVTPEGTRRAITTQELLDGLDANAAFVLERLTATRMVVSQRAVGRDDADTELELVHDSLIHSWKPLVRWLEQSREEVVFLDEVSRAAELWESRGRPQEEVWSGDALDEARARIKRCEAIPSRVTEFLEAGELQRQAQARSRRNLRVGIVGTLLVVIAVLAGVIREVNIQRGHALTLMEEAREQRDRQQQAHASALREGARAAYTKGDFLEARAKLRSSLEARDSTQARALWWQLESEPMVWFESLGTTGNSISVAPNGLSVAVGGTLVNIYDMRTLERRVLSGHKGQIKSVGFSPNGRWLASGAYDREIRLWQVKGGTFKVLKGHTEAIRDVDFSPDGNRLASLSHDETIKFWNVESGTPIHTLKTKSRCYCVSFSADGHFIISGCGDGKVRLWNTQNYDLEQVITEPETRIYGAVSSPDGKLLAYGGSTGFLVLRNLKTQQELMRISTNMTPINTLSFSFNGDSIAASCQDGRVLIWDTNTGSLRNQFQHAKVAVADVAFLPDGDQLVSSGYDGTLKLWKQSVHSLSKESLGHRFPIHALAFAPDGKTIVTGSSVKGEIRSWGVVSGQSIGLIPGHDNNTGTIAFNYNGKTIATGAEDGAIRLYTFPEGKLLKTLLGHNSNVTRVLFTPDRKQLVSSGYDKTIAFWDLESLTLQKSFSKENSVRSFDIDSSGRLIAYVQGSKIEVANIKTGLVLQTFLGHTNVLWKVAFSPDGKSLYSSSWDYTARRYQIGNNSNSNEIVARHQAFVFGIDIFHTHEDILGTTSADHTAKLWKIESGDVITLDGHRDEVNNLRFSPDGTSVATVSDDMTLRLWNTSTGTPLWRAPLMLENPPLLFSQQGWIGFEDNAQPALSAKQWQKRVETRGKLASATADQRTLCVATFADTLEIFDIPNDKRIIQIHHPRIKEVLAIRHGCLTRSDEDLTLTQTSGETIHLGKQVEAMSRFEDSVYLLQDGTVRILDLDGNQCDEFTATSGASAITIAGDIIALGFPDGRIEVWRRNASSSERVFVCREAEVGSVTRIIPGPPGTIIVGYANGTVGIWSLETGERLYSQHLHGPIIHLLHRDQSLFAASELGSRLRLDLSTFYTDYCQLMERVWSSVPWIWIEGRARFRERPNNHVCIGQR